MRSSGVSGLGKSPSGWSLYPPIDGAFIVDARSSITVDCRRSSSSSSAISISLRRRKELVDEVVEPDAVCKEQAAESALSLSSFATLIEKTVSCGENRSVTALKCTVTRAVDGPCQLPRRRISSSVSRKTRTLNQPRAVFGNVFDHHIPSSIPEKSKQRGGLLVTGNRISDFQYPTTTPS